MTKETMVSLEKSIIATICYYNTLDYPLTGFEIYRYLANPSHKSLANQSRIDSREYIANISFNKILDALENNLELKEIIQEKNGFYFLQGREKILFQRIKRQKLADQKWKKARKIIWFLQIIPYLRMIAVSGSLALENTRKNSDIDLLIVTKAGRIWTSRTLITILITLLGKKHHKGKTRDRICLNHYITNKSLRIPFESLYNAQTYARLVNVYENTAKASLRAKRSKAEWSAAIPLLNKKYGIAEPVLSKAKDPLLHMGLPRRSLKSLLAMTIKFYSSFRNDEKKIVMKNNPLFQQFQKANLWVKNYLFFWLNAKTGNLRIIEKNKVLISFAKFSEAVLDNRIGNWIENTLGKWQEKRIKADPLFKKPGGRITVDENQLEFHPESHEVKIVKNFNQKMRDLGLSELANQKDSGLNL